jgi:maltooligosyltrehalose trehalohydrolase
MNGIDVKKRTLGINFISGVEAQVSVWSPGSEKIELCFRDKKLALVKDALGYWTGRTNELQRNDRYRFLINGGKEFPDPASLSQPEGVHGPSAAIDLTEFKWTDASWKNLPLHEYILYELHTGTFTPEGNFASIESKLDHLKDLGVSAIEIMPVAQFAGERNWGYDGVYPFAVQNSYGGAEGLQHLVNACHQKGIAVVLDVVYNHFGPEGNYLGAYGPYVTDKYKTPWGGAVNFDDAWCDGVRHYFIENALMWFRDFHIDALRLDAVHAIKDFSPVHILREIKEQTDALMQETGRRYYLIAELDLNDNRYINPPHKNGYGMDAQWIDEFHHALRITAGGERTGYYSDFEGIEHLAKAYKDAYVYDGQFSPHRKKTFGVKADNPGHQFIVFSQNHDQVGNRMLGERTSQLVSFEMQKLLAAAVIMSPYLPMLFMGEEWGEPHPFLYFASHSDPRLAEAVRKGRKEEFAAFHAEGEAPDPLDEKTFLQSKLQWELRNEEPHGTLLRYYKTLTALRKGQPALKEPKRKNLYVACSKEKSILALHRWCEVQHVLCIMNFSRQQQSVTPSSDIHGWQKLLDSAAPEWLGPMKVPDTIQESQATSLILQPESILVYTDKSLAKTNTGSKNPLTMVV